MSYFFIHYKNTSTYALGQSYSNCSRVVSTNCLFPLIWVTFSCFFIRMIILGWIDQLSWLLKANEMRNHLTPLFFCCTTATPLDGPTPWTYHSSKTTRSLPTLASVYAISSIISFQPGNTLSISKALLKIPSLFETSVTLGSLFLHRAYLTEFWSSCVCVCVSTLLTRAQPVVLTFE